MQFGSCFLWKIWLLIFLQIHNGYTQMGKECIIDDDCAVLQWCSAGYCRCQPKYIRVDKLCFAVKNWGEECQYSEQCTDHRLICEEDTPKGLKKCVCDRFHYWDSTFLACVQQFNISQVLSMLGEHDIKGPIERESEVVFIGAMVAGLVVVIIGSICAFTVIGYCYHIKKSDNKMKKSLDQMINERIKRENLAKSKDTAEPAAGPSEINIMKV